MRVLSNMGRSRGWSTLHTHTHTHITHRKREPEDHTTNANGQKTCIRSYLNLNLSWNLFRNGQCLASADIFVDMGYKCL